MKTNPQRLYFLDWLRVLAMFAIFLFHSDRFFDYYDWHVKNSVQNIISSIHIAFFSQWIMPLFFALSGAAIFYSLRYRSKTAFFKERIKRILLPLLTVGYFITSPPQMYLERLTHNQFRGSFVDFMPSYFVGIDMFGGNFPWHAFHLWYLLYQFVFSMILLPLAAPGKNLSPGVLGTVSTWIDTPIRIWLLAIPLIIINTLIDYYGIGFIRGTGGWDLFSYLFILAYGYFFFCNEKITATLKKTWPIFLMVATLLSTTGIIVSFGIKPDISAKTPITYICLMTIRCLGMLAWLFAIIGLGEKYLNINNRFIGYANQAVLPFYILHQFVLLLIGYWVVQLNMDALIKYLMIAGLSFGCILVFYDVIIKRFQITRLLFGLKMK